MKLYHGSNMEIRRIDLQQCKPYKDFGRGFYCTTIYTQAVAMAKRVVRIYGGTPVVTEYDFDKSLAADTLKVRCFKHPRRRGQSLSCITVAGNSRILPEQSAIMI